MFAIDVLCNMDQVKCNTDTRVFYVSVYKPVKGFLNGIIARYSETISDFNKCRILVSDYPDFSK